MSTRALFIKDPDAVLDYALDWSAWLAAEEIISSSDWTVSTIAADPAALVIDSDSHADGIATAWLSGGTPGNTYTATCQITTDQQRTDERTITITVRER